jgi:Ca2+-binding EF-hand superfamily protein
LNDASSDIRQHTTGTGRSGQSILQYIAEKVEQKSKNVRVVFRNFDEDKSGSVDYTEFRRGLAHLGITLSDDEFQTLLVIIDNDQSGTIDYNEFVEDLKSVDEQQGGFFGDPGAEKKIVAAHPTQAPQAGEAMIDAHTHITGSGRSGQTVLAFIADKVEQKSKNVRVVFRNFDEDKSGSVDYDEFRRGLAHLGITLSDEEFQALLGIIDNDQSGTIDYNEFVEDLKHTDQQTTGFGA